MWFVGVASLLHYVYVEAMELKISTPHTTPVVKPSLVCLVLT